MLTGWQYLFSCYLLWVAATTKQRECLLLMNEGVAGVFSGCQTFYGGALSVTHISTPIITIFNRLLLFRRYYMFSLSSFCWYLFSLSTYFSVTWAHARFHYSTNVSDVHELLPFSGAVRKSEINKQHLCLLKLTTFFNILFLHSYHPHQSSSSPPLSLVSIIITIIIAAVVIIIFIVIIIVVFRLKYAFSSWQ